MDAQLSHRKLDSLRSAVDRRLGELLPDPGHAPHRLHAAMRYALLAPGKRLRPILTLLAASCFDVDEDEALDPACAVEMVHAASLILDDLPCMDDAEMRRGQPSTHKRYGQDVAILAAVALLNHAFAVIGQSPRFEPAISVKMVKALSTAVGMDGLVAGQESDLRRDESASLDVLTLTNERKTAVLFAAAVELGACVGKAAPAQVEALRRFALELGLAFQAIDDLDDQQSGEDAGLPTVATYLGAEGVRREALSRLDTARRVLRDGVANCSHLDASVELLAERIMVRS